MVIGNPTTCCVCGKTFVSCVVSTYCFECDPSYHNLRQQMEQELKRRLGMSIDARVDRVSINADGSGQLFLRDRPARRRGDIAGIAGQATLFFDSAPADVGALEGKDIWGGDDTVMLGDRKIARRDGYTKIVFEVGRIVTE